MPVFKAFYHQHIFKKIIRFADDFFTKPTLQRLELEKFMHKKSLKKRVFNLRVGSKSIINRLSI